MNTHIQTFLQHKALVEPDKNWFLFHPNYSLTSQGLKKNRIYAHLLKKLLLISNYKKVHFKVKKLMALLLKHLTYSFFHQSDPHQPENEEQLIYFHEMFLLQVDDIRQSHQVLPYDRQELKENLIALQELFSNENSGHKKIFKVWKKKLSILMNDDTNGAAISHINHKQYDTDFLNNPEYQKIREMFGDALINLDSLNRPAADLALKRFQSNSNTEFQ